MRARMLSRPAREATLARRSAPRGTRLIARRGHHLPTKPAGTYRLTPALEAAHAGGPVVCLASQAVGQTFRLLAARPEYSRARDAVTVRPRGDVFGPDGTPVDVDPAGSPVLIRISIVGPLEQRAGYHDPCSGWTDGYDAIAERMIEALADGDVLLVVDSPGGAVCGLPECVEAVLAAKAMHGRRITVVASGMAASAGYWLASALADPGELYVTRSSMLGSIGARSAHCDESSALVIAGVAMTDFAYPAGKIALSPNRAPTAVGIARAERDVMSAFEAFCAAVAVRPALTRKAIVQLDADMLTGKAAVKAGLADAVAPLEDVEAWALSRAASPGDHTMSDNAAKAETMPGKPGEGGDEEDAAKACAKCGDDMGDGARYCAKCGARAMDDGDGDEDDAPPSSKPAALAPTSSTVASILGLHATASDVAVKTAAQAMHTEIAYVRKTLGASDFGSVRGKLRAMSEDVARGGKAAESLKKERAASERRERLDILRSLAASDLPGLTRGDLLRDVLSGDQVTGLEPNASNPIATAPIGELRAYAASKLASAQERSPFEPDVTEAAKAAGAASDKALADDPGVKAAVKAGVPLDKAIEIHKRQFGKTPTTGATR